MDAKKKPDDLPRFCANCAYYCMMEGECRRHAPRPRFELVLAQESHEAERRGVGTDEGYNQAAWPYVQRRHWCGEYQEAAIDFIEEPIHE